MKSIATQRAEIQFLTQVLYDATDADKVAQAESNTAEADRLAQAHYIDAQDGLAAAITKLRADALADLDHKTTLAKQKAEVAQATANARQAAKDQKEAAEKALEQTPVAEKP